VLHGDAINCDVADSLPRQVAPTFEAQMSRLGFAPLQTAIMVELPIKHCYVTEDRLTAAFTDPLLHRNLLVELVEAQSSLSSSNLWAPEGLT